MVVFLGGCGAEQPMAPAKPPVKVPVVAEPAPAPEPVVIHDPLSLDPTPAVSGVDEGESVDDILAELNAIQLDGLEDNPLGDPDKVVALMPVSYTHLTLPTKA